MKIPTLNKGLKMSILLAILLSGGVVAQTRLRTTAGMIDGAIHDDTGVRQFRGIPYAAPPVGDNRWRAPRPRATRRTG